MIEKATKPRVMYHRLVTWKWDGAVICGGTAEHFAAFAKSYIDATIQTGCYSAGHSYVEYGKPWLIWIESLANLPTLAHEALHVAAGVLEARGLKHTPESEEAYTYTMEEIIRVVMDQKKWAALPDRKEPSQ